MLRNWFAFVGSTGSPGFKTRFDRFQCEGVVWNGVIHGCHPFWFGISGWRYLNISPAAELSTLTGGTQMNKTSDVMRECGAYGWVIRFGEKLAELWFQKLGQCKLKIDVFRFSINISESVDYCNAPQISSACFSVIFKNYRDEMDHQGASLSTPPSNLQFRNLVQGTKIQHGPK